LDWQTLWTALAAAFAGVTAVFIGFGGFLAYRQLTLASASSQLQAAATLLTSTDEGQWRGVRRLLYRPGFGGGLHAALEAVEPRADFVPALDEYLKSVSPTTSDAVNHDQLHGYVASLETVAMLFLYGLAPDALVNAYFGRIVLHHWPILQPYAGHVRKYYGYVEFLQHLEGWHKVLKDVD